MFIDRRVSLSMMLAACRPQQWMKNVLLFLPLLAAHVWALNLWLKGIGGFIAFSFVCSGVYIINDVLDKPFDRAHPRKSMRPIAAGRLETTDAIGLVIGLAVVAMAVIIGLGSKLFLEVILLYVLSAFAYSLLLKRLLLIDVFVLAGLYILRLLAGSVVTDVALSAWLLGVSLFAFSSLAFLKRFSSLQREEFGSLQAEPGRGYIVQDRQALGLFGVVSAFSALVMLCLYMQSETVFLLYQQPMMLYLLIPLLFFLLVRVWLLAYRGEVQDDPVAFFLQDKTSYFICVLGVVCVILSS
jgi:4-hydroxybenzoate polyprenyltransferase